MFALVDCNAFYASCEQVFRPDLRGKPVVVLSNNDGFIVARTAEAKRIGIPNLAPFFEVEELLRKHRVAVFSSNYPLYGDLSRRVVETLREYAAELEIYSIDEVFLRPWSVDGDLERYGHRLREAVWRRVRIPVGVGIARTKTLAKLANRAAKRDPALRQVCVLEDEGQREALLRGVEVGDIWGIGSRCTARLHALGIHTGWELAKADAGSLRRLFSVCMERTVRELNGVSCFPLEEVPDPKQEIFCTRSFGEKTGDLVPILEATALYASRAAEKLRAQGSLAQALHVFIQTSPFDRRPYANSTTFALPCATDDTRVLVRHARGAAQALYRGGYAYLKSGVGLLELVPRRHRQEELFQPGPSVKTDRLMAVLDSINREQGRGTVMTAAEGVRKKWAMRQSHRSRSYTTRWSQLPVARCR